jgi:hypothetical protein
MPRPAIIPQRAAGKVVAIPGKAAAVKGAILGAKSAGKTGKGK